MSILSSFCSYLLHMLLRVIFMFHSIWWQFPVFELWKISCHSSCSVNNAKFNSLVPFGQRTAFPFFLLSFFFLVFNFCFILLHIERMHHMGNAFVACGVVYCIDSYNVRSTTINFAYDFKTGRTWNPNIQFTNQYGYNSMVDYNPSERVLYAWDNKRLVTYPITSATKVKRKLHQPKTAPKLNAFLSTEQKTECN